MRRAIVILVTGVVLAAAGFAAIYHFTTVPLMEMEQSNSPELAWLKKEFQLDDAEYVRVSNLHESYLRECGTRCAAIDRKNQELTLLLGSTNRVTPEIEKLLMEAAQLRAECQKAMLQHFYEVSRSMPPEQGRRYLDWVQKQTVLTETHSSMSRHN